MRPRATPPHRNLCAFGHDQGPLAARSWVCVLLYCIPLIKLFVTCSLCLFIFGGNHRYSSTVISMQTIEQIPGLLWPLVSHHGIPEHSQHILITRCKIGFTKIRVTRICNHCNALHCLTTLFGMIYFPQKSTI